MKGLKTIRKTIYLTENHAAWEQSLRKALEEEHILFSSGMSEAGWMRLIFEAGLQTLTHEARLSQEA